MSHLYARVVGGKFTPIRYTASDLRYNQTLNNIISRGDSVYPIIGELLNTGTAQSPIYRDPLAEEIDNQICTLADLSEVITITPPGGGGDVNTIDKLIGLLGSPTLTSALLDAHVSTDIGRSDIAIMNSIPEELASKPNVINAIVDSTSFLSNVASNVILAKGLLLNDVYIKRILLSIPASKIVVDSALHNIIIDSYLWDCCLLSTVYANTIRDSLKGITDVMGTGDRRRKVYSIGGQSFASVVFAIDTISYNYVYNELSETKTTYSSNTKTLYNAPAFIFDIYSSRAYSSDIRIYGVYPIGPNDYMSAAYTTTPNIIGKIAPSVRISATANNSVYTVYATYVAL